MPQESSVIVTGASSGIGRATALMFAASGAWVLGVDRNEEQLQETCRLAAAKGGRVSPLAMDLTAEGAAEFVVQSCVAERRRIDCLVNNVGRGAAPPMHLTSDDQLQYFVNVNLLVAFRLSRAAVLAMRAAGAGGSIVNIASGFGIRGGMPGNAAYAAAKGGVIAMTYQTAAEYGRDGIRANAVAPGLIRTPATVGRIESGAFAPDVDLVPLGRVGEPEDVAHAVFFLAGRSASFITGQVLAVDGGWSTTHYTASRPVHHAGG